MQFRRKEAQKHHNGAVSTSSDRVCALAWFFLRIRTVILCADAKISLYPTTLPLSTDGVNVCICIGFRLSGLGISHHQRFGLEKLIRPWFSMT